MSATPHKDFGPIRDDYAFFENHSNEAACDLAAYQETAAAALRRAGMANKTGGLSRVLDFGCGPGGFSRQFLTQLACPPEQLSLTLVEPQPAYRELAAANLAEFSAQPIAAWECLPSHGNVETFDLILANHVFYYVPELEGVLHSLTESLAAGGVFTTAIAGHDNALIQFWKHGFDALGMAVPYNTAEDVVALLSKSSPQLEQTKVHYRLEFADHPEHRASILRFLFAEHFPKLPADILNLFEPYARDGMISMDVVHDHLTVFG